MSSGIICFKHQNYDGQQAPKISCQTCCQIFVRQVKMNRDHGIQIDYKAMSLKGSGLNPRSRRHTRLLNVIHRRFK